MLQKLPVNWWSFLSRGLESNSRGKPLRTLRIALISPFYPLKGGISLFSGLMMDALRQTGYDVVPVPFKALYPDFLLKDEAKTGFSPDNIAGPASKLKLFNPFTWQGTIRSLKQLKPDLLVVAYWAGFLAPFCFVLRYLTGIRLVVLLHNFSSHESFFFEPLMQRVLALSADGYLTFSASVSRELLSVVPDARVEQLFLPLYQSEVAVPSTGDARRELGIDASAPVLLFFGYVRHYKGLDLLLRALLTILQREPSLRLIVAGAFYEDIERYHRLIDELGIAGSVDLYAGYSSVERSALFFAASDCVVLPYRSATQSAVVQQAYGYIRPVIVTPVGALPEVVRHGSTGWIAPESSSEGLAVAVGEFLDRRHALPAMHRAITEYSRQFSWEAFAREAGRFFESEASGR
jgi:glycosyltransferase involved in cell wall biosynthesis